MTSSFLLLLATTFPGLGGGEEVSPFERAIKSESSYVVRGQSPYAVAGDPLSIPPPQSVQSYYPPASPVQSPMMMDPFANPGVPQYSAPIQDPWMGGSPQPYAAPMMGQQFYTYGINGPQPMRFGWQSRYDVTWIPSTSTKNPNVGTLEILGVDIVKELKQPIGNGWVGTLAPQFNYRSYQGPNGENGYDLPGGAYRFGLEMGLQTPTVNGWTIEGAFTPAIGTDMRSSLSRDAIMLDGRLVGYWQLNQKWMWAIGAVYWDRVDDIVLPYAGAVWTPNDIWEFRLIFPKPRVSAFLGMPMGVPTWIYAEAEYHVEAYEMKPSRNDKSTRVQFSDWRAVGGLRWETGTVTSFVEGGFVFGRNVHYYGPEIDDFDPNSGFIGRIGFRY